MDKLKALRYFHRAAELSSFSAAAARFDLPVSSVSRRIKDLESELGVELLKRSTRHVSLTEMGQLYYDKTIKVLKDIDDADSLVSQRQGAMEGKLHISATQSYGEKVLMPILQAFNQAYPNILLQLDLSEKLVDFDKDSVDIAIRATSFPDSRVVAKLLDRDELVAVISPLLLAKLQHEFAEEVLSVASLKLSPVVQYQLPSGAVPWYVESDGQWQQLELTPVFVSNSGESILSWALAAKGIAMFPRWWVRDYLDSNQLVPLPLNGKLSFNKGQGLDMYILYPQAKYQVPKIKRCVDFIREQLSELDTPSV